MAKINGFETEKAEPFLNRIETLMGDMASATSAHMTHCKQIRQDIKDIYAEADDAGVPKRALKGLVKYRELEAKQDAIESDLEGDDVKIYDALVTQLGELGAAAKRAAETARGGKIGDQAATHSAH